MTEKSGRRSRPASSGSAQGSRLSAKLLALLVCLGLFFSGFVILGSWQVKRLAWKEDLIARVTQRIHAKPVDVPGAAEWPFIRAESHEYRRVQITGSFLHEHAVKVQATTRLGSGYWLLTPLRTADRSIVLINRGFIPQQTAIARQASASADSWAAGQDGISTLTGLLRISEPEGSFLRKNDPAQDRWYSRDVHAIAAERGLKQVAPYFIDADAFPESVYDHASDRSIRYPVGGLTVVSFANNHLVYALTWFALALMTAGAAAWVMREELRSLRAGKQSAALRWRRNGRCRAETTHSRPT